MSANNCNPVKDTDVFLQVRGEKAKSIVLKNNNFVNALKPLVKDAAVLETIAVE